MSSVNATQLRQLRAGDRLSYYGVLWQVMDYSTYEEMLDDEEEDDDRVEEWLLRSRTGKEYYLLYESEISDTGDRTTTWYIAEQLRLPAIYAPQSGQNLTDSLAQAMLSHQTPYPQLKALNRLYQFESLTEGDYNSAGTTEHRITWDYWDQPQLWNLALEVWSDGRLDVYSTRAVQPADFRNLQTATLAEHTNFAKARQPDSNFDLSSLISQVLLALLLVGVGLILMLAGI
jgi:Domain of unknown function (DUF4178)